MKLPLPVDTRYPVVKEVAETGAVLRWSANRIRDEINYGHGMSYFIDRPGALWLRARGRQGQPRRVCGELDAAMDDSAERRVRRRADVSVAGVMGRISAVDA